MRKLLSLVVGAGLLVSLAACSSAPAGFAGCTSGTNAALVTADGKIGDDPQATFPTPIVAKSNDVHVLSRGDGEAVDAGDAADITVTVYDGTSGDPITQPGGSLRLFVSDTLFPFATALECAPVGSRVSITGTSSALLGETASGLNLTDDQSIVIVADINKRFLGKANGADQILQAGFPSVVLAPDGRPGLTFPDGDAPTDLKIAALKQGNGATVKKGDTVIVNQAVFDWESKSAVLDSSVSSWIAGRPLTVTADETATAKGLAQALIGQKVGSQVIVIAPPDYGYPDGTAPTAITAGSTLVFVVDILGIG